jgi:voltage-gated potassium channel
MLSPVRFLHKLFTVLGAVFLVLLFLLGGFFTLALVIYFAERGQHLPNSPTGFAESLYFSAVTALTIGYGDLVPHTLIGRCASILLALIGVTLTGIVAAAAVRALEMELAEEHGRAGKADNEFK